MATHRESFGATPNGEGHPAGAGAAVLVTGAGGFVGGHVAHELARAGYRVKALTRRAIPPGTADPRIEWVRGDLCNPGDLDGAVEGARAVVHAAGWVSLGADRRGLSRRVNVDATRDLLDRCVSAGVGRFVYTSTLWTTAAGTAGAPADEESAWNLEAIRSPYSETKREAERLVLARNGPGFRTSVLCPGMVVGPGDRRPSSTGLLLALARAPVAVLPGGGIPVIDVRVLARAHRMALETGAGGRRYVVAGPYLSYHELARWVRVITGRPRWIVAIPDGCGPALRRAAALAGRLFGDLLGDVSAAAVAGGFLRLYVSGARADSAFGLTHPPAARSIFEALDDHRASGRAPWLAPLRPLPGDASGGDAPGVPPLTAPVRSTFD